jgi:Chlorophyll A-B binding protein
MKLTILASIIACASAFAPVSQKTQTTVLSMSFEDELGAQAPLGFWGKICMRYLSLKDRESFSQCQLILFVCRSQLDPLGLVSNVDQAKFDRLRYVELKHGRISMLAVVGYLVAEAGVRLPGNIDYSGTTFASIPNGFAALSAIPGAGIAQLVAFIGFLELGVMKDITGGEFVGDFRNDAIDFGWDSFDEETKMTKRAIELNQGRAAQMGILALMVHEQLGTHLYITTNLSP